jgi:hypothetical protein
LTSGHFYLDKILGTRYHGGQKVRGLTILRHLFSGGGNRAQWIDKRSLPRNLLAVPTATQLPAEEHHP